MILVNTPGDGRNVYGPLNHADWHGWTLTDCVFPGFVWIVGASIALSVRQRPGINMAILRRAAILFALGLLIYAFPTFPLDTFRILGVLQRIAICYAVTAYLHLYSGIRAQIAISIALLAGYWALMAFNGDFTVAGNFAHSVDKLILGAHNYAQTKTWDPEGIISTLPAIATCLIGLQAGYVLKSQSDLRRRAVILASIGIPLICAALLLDPVLPINKKLWTSTFTLLMAGLDFLTFAVLIWLIDILRFEKPFQPAIIMGRNAIALYLSSEFIEIILHQLHWKQPIYETLFLPLAAPINASLLYAIAYTLLHLGIAYVLHRRNLYLRV